MASLRRAVAWLDDHAPEIALATTGVTFFLLLLGLYTAAVGAGATCNETYPGCAGQLSPIGLTLPQFIEWFHRFVAMAVGFVIFGNALVLQHRFPDTNASRSGWIALFILPLQVVLGGTTVTFAGLVEGGYAPPVQSLHFVAAFAIFAALVAATAWAYQRAGRVGPNASQTALTVGAGAFLAHLLLARDLLFAYTATAQTLYHFAALLGFAALFAALCWNTGLSARARTAAGAAIGFYLGETALTVGLVLVTTPVELAAYVAAALALVAAGVAARTPDRGDRARPTAE
ncbi:COX15/CtaA family protein [Salarchaeum sp. JOR-1]|uniref:COX15/CtaA family protein n=1 Tax=Salarchaeum sp. JOR-1 TaxID=2599399 RepID=UPI00119888B0|nr:COX15/CtaA family protein [Salarchaeum sp. JOR-1]QDX41755.1 heme A synthase [Salarchaeum sp. JOR-1]